jgi:murein DD-endopeptidase MepM/ murein hydrolase activator NlpD
MTSPIVLAFPVQIPLGFVPTDADRDGTDRGPTHKVCPGYDAATGHRPRWGGGFDAPRGPDKLAHRAIDIMAAEGAFVCAPAPCTIEWAGWSPKGGHHLFLIDPNGWRWYFAHLRDTPLAVTGQSVEAGDVVGFVGRTGNAVRTTKLGLRGCPHLHASLSVPMGAPKIIRGPDGASVARRGTKVDVVPFLLPLYQAGGWRRDVIV